MIKLVAIADDLTGANDTALQFAKKNIKSCVKIKFEESSFQEDKDVIVIDSDSRDLSAIEAYDKVKSICELIKEYPIKCIYKKIDSTLRGNIGAEIKAIDDVFNPQLVLIAPAYPINQRITIGGYHLLDGLPLELTEIANAPKTPVKESYIPDILSEQVKDKNFAILDYLTIKKGVEAVKQKLNNFINKNVNWIICDSVEDNNFISIMDAVKDFKKILWVGSAGLADYITYFYNWKGTNILMKKARNGSTLICAGSISHVTQNQVQMLLNEGNITLIKIDIPQILLNENSINKYIESIQKLIYDKRDVLIVTAQNDNDVKLAITVGKKYNLSTKEVSELIAKVMAKLVNNIDLSMISGLVLTGGDIAVHICKAIGIDSIEIIDEVDVAIPLGYAQGKEIDKLFIVTKAGAFGKPDAFIKSVKAIKNVTLY